LERRSFLRISMRMRNEGNAAAEAAASD